MLSRERVDPQVEVVPAIANTLLLHYAPHPLPGCASSATELPRSIAIVTTQHASSVLMRSNAHSKTSCRLPGESSAPSARSMPAHCFSLPLLPLNVAPPRQTVLSPCARFVHSHPFRVTLLTVSRHVEGCCLASHSLSHSTRSRIWTLNNSTPIAV
jgi:hypothetical protein